MAIQAQTVRYVTENGTGDGTSWANASNDIQAMINQLDEVGGGEIRVAQGNYVPTQKVADVDINGIATTERDRAFLLKSNISLYGGYSGTGNNPDEKNFDVYISILNGAINETDTAYHVVVAAGMNDIVLDGFTITNGRGLYSFEDPEGVNIVPEESFANVKIDDMELTRTIAGGIFLYTCSSLSLNNLKIEQNWAAYAPAFGIVNSDFKFENSTINNNQNLEGLAGGGYIERSAAILKNMIFRSNTLNKDRNGGGGALFQQYGTLRIEDSVFEYNKSFRHGAIQLNGTTEASLERVHIRNNTGGLGDEKLGAGGIFAFAGLSCKDVWLTDNSGTLGGAFQLNGSLYDFDNVTMERNTIHTNSNSGSGYGGAIHFFFQNGNDACFKIRNSIIRNNKSEKMGGAIYANSGRNINFDITNTVIENNEAEVDGGALYLEHVIFNNFNVNIQSCLIAGNEVTGTTLASPSIIYLDNTKSVKLNLLNSTIVNNKMAGTSYMVMDHENVTLQNSILWGNLNGSDNVANIDNILNTNISHSLVQGFDLTATGGVDGTAPGLITNLIFKDYDNKNYTLLGWTTNPAVNSGDNSLVTTDTDLNGYNRLYGQVDMGAYEAHDPMDPFAGGNLNNAGEREFSYTGTAPALSLNAELGATATFDWICIDDSENKDEDGTGLPTEGGLYTVNATLSGGGYDGSVISTTVRINPVGPKMTFDAIPALKSDDDNYPLSVTFTDENIINADITYSSSDESIVKVNGSTLEVQGTAGSAVILARWEGNRNYNSIEVKQTVYIQDADEFNARIAMIRVNGVEAIPDPQETTQYTVSIPFAEKATIEVIPESSLATVIGDSEAEQDLNPGEVNNFNGQVKAKDEGAEPIIYTLSVTVQSNVTSLSAVKVNGHTAAVENGNYRVTIPYAAEATLSVETTDPNATVEGGNPQTITVRKGENIRTVTVIAEDGTQGTHDINIYVQNNAAYLSGITVNGTAATLNGQTYTVTIDPTATAEIIATVLDANSQLSGDPTGNVQVQAGENTFTYTVTSEDGKVQNTYTLIVTVTDNDTSLFSVLVNGIAARGSNNRYTVSLEPGTTDAQIVVKTTSTKATVIGHGIKAVTPGTNRFTLTVTAEDGTEATYELVVTVKQTDTNTPNDPDPVNPDPNEPDPNPDNCVVRIHGTLPSDITIEPGLGVHQIEYGQSLTLTINLGDRYDDMIAYLVIDNDTIELTEVLRSTSYTYTLTKVEKNMSIKVLVKDKEGNIVVSNTEIQNGSRIWAANGSVFIQSPKPDRVFIYTMQGRLYTEQRIAEGEAMIHVPAGAYIVLLGESRKTEKIIVGN